STAGGPTWTRTSARCSGRRSRGRWASSTAAPATRRSAAPCSSTPSPTRPPPRPRRSIRAATRWPRTPWCTSRSAGSTCGRSPGRTAPPTSRWSSSREGAAEPGPGPARGRSGAGPGHPAAAPFFQGSLPGVRKAGPITRREDVWPNEGAGYLRGIPQDGRPHMPLWILWIVAAVALGIAEALTLTLSLGLLAVAALVAAVVGALGMGVAAQVIAFVVASAAGVLVVRPIARRHLRQPPLLASGTAALIGKSGVVLEEVTGDHGLIKLSGEEWSARALDEEHVIPAGTHVDVMEIDGATAVVYPREALP